MDKALIRARMMRWGAWSAPILVLVAVLAVSSGRDARASVSVSGSVKNPSNAAVANSQLNFWGPGGGGGANSDGSGNFTVSLNPGHYSGQAMPPEESPLAPSLVQDFDVVSGGVVNLNFQLTNVQLQGRFTRSDGSGVRGSINVFNADNSRNVHVESDDDGYYRMGGFPAGSYTVQPMVGWNVTGLVAPDQSDVTLSTNSAVTRNFTLTAAAKTISGTVTRTTGAAVEHACVNANKMNGQGWASAQTNSSGSYTLAVTGGSWNVQVNPCEPEADWIFNGTPVMIDFAMDGTTESKSANFKVTSATVTVSGTVTDQNGTKLTNGSIDFRTESGAGAHAQVQSNGTYSVRTTGGTYAVYIWTPTNAYSLPPTSVTLVDNQSKVLNLVVQAKTAHIKGTVKTAGGAAASNVMVNANEMTNTAGKPGAWSNARSDSNGNFDMLVTPGTYNVNVGTEPNSTYVWVNPSQIQVAVPTATSTVTQATYPALNFVVAQADAKIVGRLTAGGQPIANAPLCIYARPVGVFNQPCSPLQPNGTFTINVTSAGGTAFEMGCFSPPNMPYSCPQSVRVTVTPNGTVTKDLDLLVNNSSIVGQLYDQSGFPLSNCTNFRGSRVFADNPGGQGSHYEGEIQTDCRFRISLVAGVYFLNSFFSPESGAMNAPPGSPVQVFSGQTVQKNIMVAKSDATIVVKLLDKNGNGTQGYINVDNNEEINMSRSGDKGPGGDRGAELGFGKKTPCGAKDIPSMMKCCSNSKNKAACVEFKIPDGPNGCRNAYECVKLCKSSPQVCDDAKDGDRDAGPEPGEDFTGPGGCKSEGECQQYCSVPEHQEECAKFKPPASVQSQSVSRVTLFGKKPTRIVSSLSSIRALATTSSKEDTGPGFNKGIHSGGPTDFEGNARIQVLSGHRYKVCAGLPPDSDDMPPKCQTADLTNSKSAQVTLQLRDADAQLTGKVKLPGGALASRCFVHAWAEDGSFSGQPCSANGTYRLNLTADTTWHFGADSMDGQTFFRSEEQSMVVERGTKKYTKNIELKEGGFEVPQPVTTSGECSSPMVLSMSNRARINIPAGAISTSTTGQCSCTVTPTIDLISTRSNQPQGAGYTIDCRDESGAQVTQLNSSATITVPYALSSKEEGSSVEDALKPVLYQSDSQSYQTVESYTLDKENNTITFSVKHFSAYTVSNSSGISSKNAALKTVTTTTSSKTRITSFKVGNKKVTPFPKCRGTVTVATKSVNGTQLIAAGSSCEGTVKVYTVSGKLSKTLKTGFSKLQSLVFGDVTKDGKADLVAAPANGRALAVYNVSSKYRKTNLNVSQRNAQLTASAIDFTGNGLPTLVTGVVSNGKAGNFQVFGYSRGKFKVQKSSYAAYLKNSGGRVALSIPRPTVSKATSSVRRSSKSATVVITGKGFTPNSTVLIGSLGASKVSFKSTTRIEAVIKPSKLKKGKHTVKVINPGGLAASSKVKITAK